MALRSSKLLLALTFSVFSCFVSLNLFAQEHEPEEKPKEGFNASEVIFHHILDAHEFHFLSWEGSDGKEHELAIPLPVIVYSKERGLSTFNFSKLHEGAIYDGYKSDEDGKIVAVREDGTVDESVKLYDFSLDDLEKRDLWQRLDLSIELDLN